MEINLKPTVDGLKGKVTQEAKSRGYRAANELRNAALYVLRGQRSGRVYRKPYSRSTYTASAPGEPPAVRTGQLRMSWHPQAKSEGNTGAVVVRPYIYTDKSYAPILENGSSKVAPRPFESPIKLKALHKVVAIYQEPYLTK